ncbi:MAG: SDR family NAD(P)-dependent oxidoreductase [Deltaproteobacteria bacterium]|nr:SDR family NAD(P)-dependent oxidoreductase [Deltaproteobacteria bacterium]MBK8240573.1 SDR family NAD(P)-dependent oxidoreductase [Deltaproteobacteria bacterium]MBK8718147.1 SDR family NAD(P)-dependent oxidoreductase [Deltaproteobacteria bacterium]
MSDVVVTGASSGIGASVSRRLQAAGHRVIAIVRRDDAMPASAAVVPVVVDLRADDLVALVRAAIAEHVGPAGLGGVVHCAGQPTLGPLEHVPLSQLRASFELHAVALVALAQACLPALRRGHGRIVAVGSVGGRVATPWLGAYGASKFALVGLTGALRHELRPFGIHVSLVEPGVVDTPMLPAGEQLYVDALAALPATETAYAAGLARAQATYRRATARPMTPDRVATAVMHALFAARPRPRYLVGVDAHLATTLQWLLPTRAFEWLVRRL